MVKEYIVIILYSCALGISFFGTLIYFYIYTSEEIVAETKWVNEEGEIIESYWKDYINDNGPESAFNEFSTLNHELDDITQHKNAHIFGKVLFDTVGDKAVNVCDFSFGAGCFHELASSVMSEEGIGKHSKIITNCINKAKNDIEIGDCYHAYGHGIDYYFSGADVTVPLYQECAKYSGDNKKSCASGVLMGFILPDFLDEEEEEPFENVNQIISLCSRLSGTFQQKCYPRLIQWWGGRLKLVMPPEEYILILEKFCNTLTDNANKTTCFESIGLFVIGTWVGLDSSSIQKYCSLISEKDSIKSCISGGIIRIAIKDEVELVKYEKDLEELCALDIGENNKSFCPS